MEPVILSPVFLNRFLNALGRLKLVVFVNDLLRSLYNPLQDGRAGVLHQVISVVFDFALPFELRLERDDYQPAPCPFIGRTYPWQMVCIEDDGMRRHEFKRRLIFLFATHFIGRANLLQDGSRKPDAFFHFSGNHHALPFKFGHLWPDVSFAVCRQGIR